MVTLVSAGLPVGVIMPFGGAIADIPAGFLHCDGSTINRNDFSSLFAAIGIAHGYGDTATTFEIPDLRGRFLRGQDNAAGNDPNAGTRTASATGGNTGDNVGSYQADGLGSHRHNSGVPTGPATRNHYGSYTAFLRAQVAVSSSTSQGALTNFVGGAETRPRNIYVNYIIKY